ncbi:MAG: 16S rRNA (cytosine(1402)-N(4))-methyltransferase RsmH [Puniceicoccales bacterium]|nr:16S rRNA (cytosine(1402)-N(4))-methyltransferase RsmH [Puniceicoccales bacterium]
MGADRDLYEGAVVHVPVLVAEVIEAFKLAPPIAFLDATVGGCGHAQAILDAFPGANLWGIDRDPRAIGLAAKLLPQRRVQLFNNNYSELDNLPQKTFDGILFDFGLSSDQLDAPERGFSFRSDGPLDMRMDPTKGISAAQFLNTASLETLAQAVRDFGEEQNWRHVVNAIWRARGTCQLERTSAFAELVRSVLPKRYYSKIDPATRTFQGIRIAVNGELEAIQSALPKAFDALVPGGIMAIISFHSLEDRLIKQFFRQLAGLPVTRKDGRSKDERQSFGMIRTTKPITPSRDEIFANPRCRSAKLRIFQKGGTRP